MELGTLGKLVESIIERALAEDIGPGDATTVALVENEAMASADLVARESCVIAGTKVAAAVFRRLDPEITIKILIPDGQSVRPDDVVLHVKGRARAILTGERTALNFMQRMSGIATLTAQYVSRVSGHGVRILDTRKTTPTIRTLEKYAVVCGGGTNHRIGLYDRIMIKDNHLAFWGSTTRTMAEAVRACRARYPDLEIEVEVDTPDQLADLMDDPPDWILLDNMTPEQVRVCVALCAGRSKLEVSGGITLETVALYAEAGPDAISVGALTHSARSLDLSLDLKI